MPADPPDPKRPGPTLRDDAETHRLIGRTAHDTSQTLSQVGMLRNEVRANISRIDGQLATLGEHVGELRETTAGVVGKLDMLVDEIQTDRAERSTVRAATAVAHIEVETTAEIAKIDEIKAVAQHKREVKLKSLVLLGPILTAIATYALSHC